ncbi:MAG: BspA family leucine-rich repeat surface protein, partial [Flavobacteriaceae bacterium]
QSIARYENNPPYALFQDFGGDYTGNTFSVGSYTLIVTPYSSDNVMGTAGEPSIINFEIQQGGFRPFITTWKTDNPGVTEDNQIRIPTIESLDYDYTVDWGDGTSSVGIVGDAMHDYNAPGIYTVSISGSFPAIILANSGEEEKLLEVNQWGDIAWGAFIGSFFNCKNLDIKATDIPYLVNVQAFGSTFTGCESLVWNASVGEWDVSNATSFVNLFNGAKLFNQDISKWDVSGVKIFNGMLGNASLFNQDLSSWKVNNAESMINIFNNSGLSNENYDKTLIGWSELASLRNGVQLDAPQNQYCLSETARQSIIDTYGWTINDEGLSCATPELIIVGLTLVNAENDQDLFALVDGMVIDTSSLPTLLLDVRADADDTTQSVAFELIGSPGVSRYENNPPYALFQDFGGDYVGNTLTEGIYTLTATPYSKNGLGGTKGTPLTVTFNLTDYLECTDVTPVSLVPLGDRIHTGASSLLPLDGGFPAGGTYSGIGVTGNQFDSSVDPGIYEITYSYTDPQTGCTQSASQDIHVISSTIAIDRLVLVNADTEEDLFELTEGMIIDADALPTLNLDIRAETVSQSEALSVAFDLTGTQSISRHENNAPYVLYQDINGDYKGNVFELGNYSLTATPYSSDNVMGTAGTPSTINFEIQQGGFRPFVTTWKTDNPGTSGYNQITLFTNPISETSPSQSTGYFFRVDWGDGQVDIGVRNTITHTYEQAGVYQISISGEYPGIKFSERVSDSKAERNKILQVNQWGDIKWKSVGFAFEGCVNLDVVATDTPDLSEVFTTYDFSVSLYGMFSGCTSLKGNSSFGNWDVSFVNKFTEMFKGAISFNQDISKWDVRSAFDMQDMLAETDFSDENYDKLLIAWSKLPTLRGGAELGAPQNKYCEGAEARQNLIESGWRFNDAGLGCEDTTAPELTLVGEDPLVLTEGDTYVDPGATAEDNMDGDITANIVVGGDVVDSNMAGTYMVTYNVSDTAGNMATELVRTVNIETALPAELFIVGLTLVNAETDEDLFELVDGMVIDVSSLPTLLLDVRADAHMETRSIAFELNGPQSIARYENNPPYALFQDFGGDYTGNTFSVGSYTLIVTPYSRDNVMGTAGTPSTINFELVETSAMKISGNSLSMYPNPTSEYVSVTFEQPLEIQKIFIYDTLGRLLRTYDAEIFGDSKSYEINIQDLPMGTYFVRTEDMQGNQFQKQMVIRR